MLIYSVFSGMLAAIFVWLIAQPSVSYPTWMIELLEQPLVLMVSILLIYVAIHLDLTLGILFALCAMFVVVDLNVIGKPREREALEKMHHDF
jgi:hypothetical protein